MAQASRAAAFAVLCCVPETIARIYFAPQIAESENRPPVSDAVADTRTLNEVRDRRHIDIMVADIQSTLLAVFSNEYMNRHLVLSLVERILVLLLPELGRDNGVGRGVSELLADRGIGSSIGLDVTTAGVGGQA